MAVAPNVMTFSDIHILITMSFNENGTKCPSVYETEKCISIYLSKSK